MGRAEGDDWQVGDVRLFGLRPRQAWLLAAVVALLLVVAGLVAGLVSGVILAVVAAAATAVLGGLLVGLTLLYASVYDPTLRWIKWPALPRSRSENKRGGGQR